jgi:hypothetical protein
VKTWMLIAAVCAVVATAGADAVRAQARDVDAGPEARDWELTITGSGSNDKDFDNGGFGGNAGLGYYFNENVELAFRQGIAFSKTDTVGSRTSALSRLALDFHFDGGRVQPFVGANIGYVYGDAVRESFAAAPELGFKFYVRPDTFIMLMGEYQFFFEDSSDASDQFDDGQFVYTLGMGFNF